MRQYKIVQTGPNNFHIEWRKLFFWHKLKGIGMYLNHPELRTWANRAQAEDVLKWLIKSHNYEDELKNFKRRVWFYPPERIDGKDVSDL
jgi:hypothetical protein